MNTTDRRFCIRFIDEVLEKIFDEIKTYDLKTKELVCKFCSNGTPILKSAVHSF